MSDMHDAVAFALRHAAPKAAAGRLRLASAIDPVIAAVCDRQVGRRIAHLLIANALDACERDGAVRIEARRLRGAVLLRTTTSPWMRATGIEVKGESSADMAALDALVGEVRGTLVVDGVEGKLIVSIRLPLAPKPVSDNRAAS
jgi:hypothetical protein